jgi:pimeloyl-ACP methyl ester carboxylesterase
MSPTVVLRHGRIDLALHRVRGSVDQERRSPLLLLHGLGECTSMTVPVSVEAWPGEIWGLDFCGHGESTLPRGGGYTAEILLADADAALGHLGSATILGRGLGAWIALLLAGARPTAVRGAVLADGPGVAGGGVQPGSPFIIRADSSSSTGTPDPFALIELTRDYRPPDYASTFVRFAIDGSGLADPIIVSAVARPEWIVAVAGDPAVVEEAVPAALQRLWPAIG